MRFYTKQHPFYCGIDLHARSMYLCILNQKGVIVLWRNIPTKPERFLKVIAPYREGLVRRGGVHVQLVLAHRAMATSVPVPIAIPTSASAKAGASLMPSPAIVTT